MNSEIVELSKAFFTKHFYTIAPHNVKICDEKLWKEMNENYKVESGRISKRLWQPCAFLEEVRMQTRQM